MESLLWRLMIALTLAGTLVIIMLMITSNLKVSSSSTLAARQVQRPKKKVRVLVAVITSPGNLDTKARNVRDTWARRADTMLFFSSKHNATFPTVGLNVSEGREHLTAKTMQAFRYIYNHHRQDADWFMKADDDTYVIMENLRHFLSSHNPSEPVFFGQKLTMPKDKFPYYSGGAGYVLSKEALRRFALRSSECARDGGFEDFEMGRCMQKLGVHMADDTDAFGRSRFHSQNFVFWDDRYRLRSAKGRFNVSDLAISFHYVSPQMMRTMDYCIYRLRLQS